MQNEIEEVSNLESRIIDNPLKLLLEIKSKMYTIQREKYEFSTLMKTLEKVYEYETRR